MPKKPRTPQPQTPDKTQSRDYFQTPNYATELLVPYIPKGIKWVWEPAVGKGKIRWILEQRGFKVLGSDLNYDNDSTDLVFNFVTDSRNFDFPPVECIITNPPFSILYKFADKALEYDVPFALLIPFHMSGKLANLFDDYGCQGLVPKGRINFLTPFVINRINERHNKNYSSLDEIPIELLREDSKKSTSQFHSFWLTYKFNLPSQLTFVELTKQMKENI